VLNVPKKSIQDKFPQVTHKPESLLKKLQTSPLKPQGKMLRVK
jgi:hypothetical protein